MDKQAVEAFQRQADQAATKLEGNPLSHFWSGPRPTLEEMTLTCAVMKPLDDLPYSARRRVILNALYELDKLIDEGWIAEDGEADPDMLFYYDHLHYPWEYPD